MPGGEKRTVNSERSSQAPAYRKQGACW